MAAGKEEGELGELRNKLLSFLDISRYYEPEILISDFPFDGKFNVLAFDLRDCHVFTAIRHVICVWLPLVMLILRSARGASPASGPHGKTRAGTLYICAYTEGHVHG